MTDHGRLIHETRNTFNDESPDGGCLECGRETEFEFEDGRVTIRCENCGVIHEGEF